MSGADVIKDCSNVEDSRGVKPFLVLCQLTSFFVTYLQLVFALGAMGWSIILLLWFPRLAAQKDVIVIDLKLLHSSLSSMVVMASEATVVTWFALSALDFLLHFHLVGGILAGNRKIVTRMWNVLMCITVFAIVFPVAVRIVQGQGLINLGYVYPAKLGLYVSSTIWVFLYKNELNESSNVVLKKPKNYAI